MFDCYGPMSTEERLNAFKASLLSYKQTKKPVILKSYLKINLLKQSNYIFLNSLENITFYQSWEKLKFHTAVAIPNYKQTPTNILNNRCMHD